MFKNDVGQGGVCVYEAYEVNKGWHSLECLLLHRSLTDIVCPSLAHLCPSLAPAPLSSNVAWVAQNWATILECQYTPYYTPYMPYCTPCYTATIFYQGQWKLQRTTAIKNTFYLCRTLDNHTPGVMKPERPNAVWWRKDKLKTVRLVRLCVCVCVCR